LLAGENEAMGEKLTKVNFSNLSKILYPQLGVTKAQVIEYYIKIAPKMLSFLAGRPLALTRFPDGVDKEGFYEKDAPEGTPPWVKTVSIYSDTAEREVNYVVCDQLDTLIWLANLAAVEIHIPLYRFDDREKPDFVFFDVDPEPPISFEKTVEVTLLLKEKLDQAGFTSYVKTSGKKGLHVLVPIVREYSFRETREFAHAIGKELAKKMEIVVSEAADSKKPGTIYVDYAQNSQGRLMVCPYSLRATPEATVSTPLEWEEVKKRIKPAKFSISNVAAREKEPWKGIFENRQRLEVR
jgi:bifunctional non-homologous end joining protein LigD